MRQALLFQKLGGGQIECQLCPHYCRLQPGQTGPCRVRHNIDGELLTSAYGQPILLAVEPIEKKYLFHAFPGSQTLSLGTSGCNMGCKYCINWRVSQQGTEGMAMEVSPVEVVEQALSHQAECIAFTYTEPTIFLEYALDIARLARQAGLTVVAKSNGYISPAALEQFVPWLTAINIDLKGWQETSHYRVTGGRLKSVLDTLRQVKKQGLWLEVSTLVVPSLNDSSEDLEQMASFIAGELGLETPWHLHRFFPNYRMLNQPATSQAQLERAVDRGQRAGLHYIYTKEVGRGQMLQTICPGCRTVVIEREGLKVKNNYLHAGCCHQCGQPLAGVGLVNHKLAE